MKRIGDVAQEHATLKKELTSESRRYGELIDQLAALRAEIHAAKFSVEKKKASVLSLRASKKHVVYTKPL